MTNIIHSTTFAPNLRHPLLRDYRNIQPPKMVNSQWYPSKIVIIAVTSTSDGYQRTILRCKAIHNSNNKNIGNNNDNDIMIRKSKTILKILMEIIIIITIIKIIIMTVIVMIVILIAIMTKLVMIKVIVMIIVIKNVDYILSSIMITIIVSN